MQIIISATGQKELQSYFSSVFFNLDFYYFLTLANVKEVAIADITNSFPRNQTLILLADEKFRDRKKCHCIRQKCNAHAV